ncbi:MarR family winged helix-turn-helix transcriptional regulator [Virgibacillus ndiopensis]|uniref:MarR family winged helix-turn-helix transcriptional regulator n=1 Tax=Virgibacillus ndiopensis TaxID=2004408 RepID=UPI001FE26282|nr:MarR family transcriptional regulator [Virgibacillus ndiopensis]
MESRFIDKLSSLKLSAKQYGILQYLDEKPNSSQKQVGDALQIDRTTMVSHIDHLEEMEYVRRTRNPNDRRSFVLTTTKLGQQKLETGRNHIENIELDVLSSLTNNEQEALKTILLKVWTDIYTKGGK